MKTKTSKQFGIIAYPKSDNSYLTYDNNGQFHLYVRKSAAQEARLKITSYRTNQLKVVPVLVSR